MIMGKGAFANGLHYPLAKSLKVAVVINCDYEKHLGGGSCSTPLHVGVQGVALQVEG